VISRLYLDHAATTPLLSEAREAMNPWLEDGFGNPSSLHAEGRKAKDALDAARETLSEAFGCLFAEVIFTSGGTEGANLAILGAALANEDARRTRVLLSATEHHCVLGTRPALERLGYRVELLPVDDCARLRLDALEEALGPDVLLVSTMHANNELGTFNDIRAIAELAHRHGTIVHTDAVQTFMCGSGFQPEKDESLKLLFSGWKPEPHGADLITFSSHKVYGPRGAGAIYVRAGTKLKPLVAGGGQERELRGGTENVAAIVGFAAAVSALQTQRPPASAQRRARDHFLSRLDIEGLVRSVPASVDALPGHAHVRTRGIEAETMLIVLDRMGVSASSGAACSSGSLEPSHVLLACGLSTQEAKEGLRFSFGRWATVEEAEDAAERVSQAAARVRRAR
jgi:cysteine desulfurase